jgi:predicted NUDIX family NTP pyrophosphohydrolase
MNRMRSIISPPAVQDLIAVKSQPPVNYGGDGPLAHPRYAAPMAKRSAGIVMWKRAGRALRVLLVHPGGPFWARKDDGAWTIPKGEYAATEDALAAARREFFEELGHDLAGTPDAAFKPLGEVKQKAGKAVTAFALEGDLDASAIRSNTVEIEWPPKSGKRRKFPEVDRAAWFTLSEARLKINPAQRELLDTLAVPVKS